MSLDHQITVLQPVIEKELRSVVDSSVQFMTGDLGSMVRYHMGWEGAGSGPEAQGKRIRPILLLLSAQAAGADWHNALPAAAAVELLHNFSLIHDDIQDGSDLRRGRKTVWKVWGAPQAINAGDLLFTIAHLALIRLNDYFSPENTTRAIQLMDKTCVELTSGQNLDMAFESMEIITLDDYWSMIRGKTAALIGCCTMLGALLGLQHIDKQQEFYDFGVTLGLAFQVIDDYLGIWGDANTTGKSNESDLIARKKTLPILYGLNKRGKFFQEWNRRQISTDNIGDLVNLLDQEGAKDFVLQKADELSSQAIRVLEKAIPTFDNRSNLLELTAKLLKRPN